MEKVIVTTINGLGVSSAKNDLASFTVSLKTKGESLKSSKDSLEEKVSEVLKILSHFHMNLEGEIITARQNFKLEHREGAEKYSAGFQSAATITWTCVIDEKLDDIYKACLKLDSNMFRPSFSFKDPDSLQIEALQKAKDHVKETLEKECSLLGVSPDKLTIRNWNFGYNGQLAANMAVLSNSNYYMNNKAMGATGVMGPTGPQGAQGSPGLPYMGSQKVGSIYQELLDYIPLEPGNITVSVPVQVHYVWKE
jgi:uncharacterized protein YggE